MPEDSETLFYEEEKPDDWRDMPEFVQEDSNAFRKIIVSFETEEDVKAFAKAIGQEFTEKTKSLWFPQKNKSDTLSMWVDS